MLPWRPPPLNQHVEGHSTCIRSTQAAQPHRNKPCHWRALNQARQEASGQQQQGPQAGMLADEVLRKG